MEFADVVRQRRMTRTYLTDREIPDELVEKCLKLAIRAPSAGHTQGWEFLVLRDITSRSRFWAVTSGDGEPDSWLQRLSTAPILVVCLSDKQAYLDRYAEPDKGWTDRDETRWPIPYWDVDTGMAALLLLLAAENVGLGACFFGVPGDRWQALQEAFAVPARLRPVGVVSLGYAAPDHRSPSLRRGRRSLTEVVHRERYDSGPSRTASPDSPG